METNIKRLAIDARARLIWGTPRSEVAEWLISQGLPSNQVAAIIEAAWHERNVAIRRMGIMDLIVGGLSWIGCLLAFITVKYSIHDTYYYRSRYGGAKFGIMVFIVLFGLGTWRIFSGGDRLICGAKIKGSMTEM